MDTFSRILAAAGCGTAALGMLVALLLVVISVHLKPVQPGIVPLQLTFSKGAFEAIAINWTPSQHERVLEHFVLDFPFLAAYGAFGYVLAADILSVTATTGVSALLLLWLLPAAAALDVVENLIHIVLLKPWLKSPPKAIYFISGSTATVKFACILGFAVLALFAVLR